MACKLISYFARFFTTIYLRNLSFTWLGISCGPIIGSVFLRHHHIFRLIIINCLKKCTIKYCFNHSLGRGNLCKCSKKMKFSWGGKCFKFQSPLKFFSKYSYSIFFSYFLWMFKKLYSWSINNIFCRCYCDWKPFPTLVCIRLLKLLFNAEK